ncbi:hypothetical protein [Xenorhabdus kozodoii]|uniref:Non-ribosomal peptide synthetase n=1 Tax=Xenorhabdus kozodoii TaxID=351676 RepID=A0A2D0LFI8_9GAMM|nr:hypothetical protein [Xenorhabdus kozodoii]PHM74458.1 non-ribosomal peptide synthetase [Xenorhabdus kozodoii]
MELSESSLNSNLYHLHPAQEDVFFEQILNEKMQSGTKEKAKLRIQQQIDKPIRFFKKSLYQITWTRLTAEKHYLPYKFKLNINTEWTKYSKGLALMPVNIRNKSIFI